MGALPCLLIRLCAKGGYIFGAAGEGEHGDGLADPDAVCFEVGLPGGDEGGVIFRGLDEVGLDPGDVAARVEEELGDAIGRQATVLVHGVAALLGDGLNTTLKGDAVSTAEELEEVLVPEIDTGLEADGDGTPGDLFQQRTDLLADAEDLVDEVDVIDAAGDELVDLVEDGVEIAFAGTCCGRGFCCRRCRRRGSQRANSTSAPSR